MMSRVRALFCSGMAVLSTGRLECVQSEIHLYYKKQCFRRFRTLSEPSEPLFLSACGGEKF